MQNQTTMTKVKDCKHSVPFKAQRTDAPISSVYISKDHPFSKRTELLLTWEENSITIGF
jgi:hypothetical protein